MNNLNIEKLGELTDNGLKILDKKTYEKLENKKLSASLVTGVLDCPARWVSNYILTQFLPIELDNAMTRGSLFHRVMELFFGLENELRTQENCYNLINDVVKEEEFEHFKNNQDARNWTINAINNYFEMGAQPKRVNIGQYQGKDGLEVFVEGEIEGCTRPFLGFIDRLVVDKNGDYIIEDWKTGAKAKRYKAGNKNEIGWPEARQQILYSEIIKQNVTDKKVAKARLIFPVAQEVVNVDINNENLVNKAISDTVKAEKLLNTMVEENEFTCKPSFLCHWCPLVKVCKQGPHAGVRNEKARNSHNSQPSPEDLKVGLIF